MPLRQRRLLAALSSVVLAASGAVSLFAAAPADASVRPQAVSAIEGVVSTGSGAALPGLNVSVCEISPAYACTTAVTSSSGFYVASGLAAGTYSVTASDAPLLNASNSPIVLAAETKQTANLVLLAPAPLPQGVSIPSSNTPGPPVGMFYGSSHPFTVSGRCAGGTASFTIVQNGTVITPGTGSGAMTETPYGSGTYSGVIPAYAPNNHGYAQVTITVTCGGVTQTVTFPIWLDPSGTVIGPNGLPIGGATVTLLSAPTASGPFTPVPNGSAVMSPSNRVNPGVTAADGLFGWDVVPGWYEVQAQKAGCVAPTSPPTPVAVSPVLQIPPAVTGLLLTLDCTNSPATSITSAGAATFTAGTGGVYTLTATGKPAPTWSQTGALPAGVSFVPGQAGSASLVVGSGAPAGVTTFTATAGNGVGSNVSQSFTLTIYPANSPVITSAASADFTAGTGGTFPVTATGSPVPILSASGALPPGVTFTAGDAGTGTLVVAAGAPAGSTPFNVVATAGAASVTQPFTLTITAPAPAITSGSSAQFTLNPGGLGGTFTVTTTGVPTATLAVAGSLPPGTTFTPNGKGAATLAVAPSTPSGTFSFGIKASNGVSPAATQTFTLTVN